MGDTPTMIKQQYGAVPEKVPASLNGHGTIYLGNVPHSGMELLLRDMGQGDKLVTPKIAKEYLDQAKRVARQADYEFHEMLSRDQGKKPVPKDIWFMNV